MTEACRCWVCAALDRMFPDGGEQLAMFGDRRGWEPKTTLEYRASLKRHYYERNKNK